MKNLVKIPAPLDIHPVRCEIISRGVCNHEVKDESIYCR